MLNLKRSRTTNNSEPGLSYFKGQVQSIEHTFRQGQVDMIRKYLLRKHDVLARSATGFVFKGKQFIPSAIVLNGIKTVITFHVSYLLGNPVTITGTPKAVEIINKYYRNGIYQNVDWRVLKDLMTYGNAFEYPYLDENNNIKSKIFRNQDAYPIYDEDMNYSYFVEHWKNKERPYDEHFTIYYPNHVDTYKNNRLIDSKVNYTGLPIHYTVMDKGEYDQFGDPLCNDLIPIQNRIEFLLSKLDDALTTLALNPVGVITGSKMTEEDMINTNVAGAVLNLEEGNSFSYSHSEMDYQNIKLELDSLISQFNVVAGIPSSILGQSNVANVSQESLGFLYQLTENRGKENINSLVEGFRQRWDKMRVLMNLMGEPMTDEDFDSLNISFNILKPTDVRASIENLQTLYNMDSISKRTIIEQSPYTTDSAQELQRLKDEGNDIFDSETTDDTPDDSEESQTEENQTEESQEKVEE